MRNLLNSSLIISILVMVSGCRKDVPVPEPQLQDDPCNGNGTCLDLPEVDGIGYQYSKEGFQFTKPCFNPNNSDEFVYIRQDGTNTELVKYNIPSQQESILCDSEFIISQPNWGRQEWITFGTFGRKIWKVREDGSELTQLTFGTDDFDANFNYNGDLIYYDRSKSFTNFELDQNPELYKASKIFVIDLNGNLIDSILVQNINTNYTGIEHYQRWTNSDFSQDKVYFAVNDIATNEFGICSIDLLNHEILHIASWSSTIYPKFPYDLALFDNSIYYAEYWKNIKSVNLTTGELSTFKNGCQTKSYEYISISPDGSKMLVEKVLLERIENTNNVDEQHEIWSIDLSDSCKEEKILGE